MESPASRIFAIGFSFFERHMAKKVSIIMKQSFQFALLLILFSLLAGCRSPMKSDIHFVKGDLSGVPDNTNDTKVIIFNDSSFVLFGMDESKAINVKMNGRDVTKLGPGQYTQVIVSKGIWQVDLAHWDMIRYASQQKVEFIEPKSFLRIRATPESNEAQLVPALPVSFEKKFQPVE